MSGSSSPGNAESDLFVVDSSPSILKENFNVPTYETKFSGILQTSNPGGTIPKPQKPKPPQNLCWNCEGEHTLRDCPEKRDHLTIGRNRTKFLSRQSTPRSGKASRYHQDNEQKYPHHQPGKISSKLRRSLGLKSNQLPRHIYRMRSCGYPPGWVEEARVSHSGLVLFNSAGEEVADPGFEDGEITPDGAKDKFDVRKIIEYPGFNCQCSPDVIDETERLNAKPMNEIHSMEHLKLMWQPRAVQAYKRRKMKSEDTNAIPTTSKDEVQHSSSSAEQNNSTESIEDGEVSDDENTGQDQNVAAFPIPLQNLKRPSETFDSPEIKRQKRELKAHVESDSSSGSSKSDGGTEIVDSIGSSSLHCSPPNNLSTPTGRVKSVALGTPVIVTSQYRCLPTSEKFSKNICDVINFENLPDSTGKYEKMSGLLKKVRVTVSNLFEDTDKEDEQ